MAGFSDDKIIRIATSDNFWSAGETGPCGPCSEIFLDQGDKVAGGPPGSADQDGDRYLEFWNLVFMQYEQRGPGDRVNLPRPSIDTGMGLERMTAILQGVQSVYDIDLFKALIAASEAATGVPAKGENLASHRVIADHLRATSFLIAEGVLPSNAGRGYVLRRIMRRAMRHAHMLGAKEPLMYRLVPALVQQMGETYPELVRGQPLITETLKLEETRFRKTLEKGLGLLGEASRNLKKGDVFAGDTAFKLYDTFGFPLDLTQDALKPRGVTVDLAAFDAAMQKQKEEARKAWKGSGEAATETVWFEVKERVGATDFLGYDTQAAEGEIRAVLKDGKEVGALKAGDEAALVLNQTPFYGESGGQVGDTGQIKGPNGALFRVTDTQKKLGDLFVHLGTVEKGAFKPGDGGRAGGRSRATHGHTRQPLRHPPGARGPAPGARRARRAARIAGRARSPALRLPALQAHVARRAVGGGGHGQRLRAAEHARRDPADGPRGCAGDRRARPVRREVRRGGARRLHGCRRGWHGCRDQGQQGLVGGAVRRHARDAHRRHRPHQAHRRERQRGRRAAHRGADRGRRARAPGAAGCAHARAGGGAAHQARRRRRARQGPARGAQADRARPRERQAPAGARRRRDRQRRGPGRDAPCAPSARSS